MSYQRVPFSEIKYSEPRSRRNRLKSQIKFIREEITFRPARQTILEKIQFLDNIYRNIRIKKKKLIIIGHSGFVGKAVFLSPKFKRKFKIYGYNSKNFNLEFYKKINENLINKIKGSILIFSAGKHRIYGDSRKLQKYNEKIFKNLLNIFINNKPKKVIFLSSAEVYGGSAKGEKINEKSKVKPINNYSRGKINIEKRLILEAKKHRFEYLILRLPGIFGKNDTLTKMRIRLVEGRGS